MKKLIFSIVIVLHCYFAFSQEYKWTESNTYTRIGERIVAEFNTGEISQYDACQVIGRVIDSNSNWGYCQPTVADFRLFIRFSGGLAYGLIQTEKTNNIILGLRKISDSHINLVALCPHAHTGVRVEFTSLIGVKPTLGNPQLVLKKGESLVASPTYRNFTNRVGIASNNPSSAMLSVGGKIEAKEVAITNALGADFVFDDNYSLLSIEQVKEFVEKNKHLPGVAPAREMEENELSLNEFNQTLLQKIEELTLYVIQLKEENKKQQEELEQLKQTSKQ